MPIFSVPSPLERARVRSAQKKPLKGTSVPFKGYIVKMKNVKVAKLELSLSLSLSTKRADFTNEPALIKPKRERLYSENKRIYTNSYE